MFPAVGPTASSSRLWLWSCGSLVQSVGVKEPGVSYRNDQAGFS